MATWLSLQIASLLFVALNIFPFPISLLMDGNYLFPFSANNTFSSQGKTLSLLAHVRDFNQFILEATSCLFKNSL